MASSYRGLYKCLPKQDRPTHIQVVDTGGNSLPLPIDTYEDRDVQPDWRKLPWQGEDGAGLSGLQGASE
ncbi:hypothetical protein GGQ91_003297 [Methylobacterium fujisawaense]|uniref:Uncharacterized protein n=1 Tax=Methylobacterium fujisawaense TaxID=107400 RepID=A0ABR6DCS7_9HYPH|nr:hypothetical protein [Methylobacterium fujisawaense]MBA9063896.1 hypothetical protein [Methylobacterium fujisawaense]